MKRRSRLVVTAMVLASVSLGVGGSVCAQFGGPEAPPPLKEESGFKIMTPTVDAKEKSYSLPAAFWDQHMASWVEVAMCGRPSDFLHETIASITTTRTKMIEAARAAGFRDADYWVSNVADFPRVRGDRAMVMLEVELGGKREKFPLDELLTYQSWGVSIGPYGWMFKGDPEREIGAPASAPATTSAATGPATATAPAEPPLTPAQIILGDDPQIALQFKGIQHLSRSFLDHPLCYDTWVYPVIRYQRNYAVTPRVLTVPKTVTTQPDKTEKSDSDATSLGKFWGKLYGSNGDVKVTMTITKVNEEEFLTAMAANWHDAAYAAYIKEQLPVGRRIDADKGALEKLIPEFRAMLKKGTPHEDVLESETFARMALLSAKIEKGYAALDAAWAVWAAEHPVFDTLVGDDRALEELRAQARLWREHMTDWKDRAAHLADAEAARFEIRELKTKPAAENKTPLAKANGRELAARSHALLLEIRHALMYWQYEKGRIGPDETRVDWVRNIATQLELTKARETLGKAGVALGEMLAKDPEAAGVAAAQDAYKGAMTRVALAELEARLADVEFEVHKFESIEGAEELVGLRKQRDTIAKQIDELKKAMEKK